jgi:pimeloyl-ACP methyl ester carboxylesterase
METVTFVLVHGAWHGGWCWKKLAHRLRQAGCEVYTPTLTGLGERAHLLAPGIDLTTHTDDIVAVLDYEDLHDVVLVGHSYGGMVIAGVAERVPDRIGTLVYLDAFVPEHGATLRDYLPGKVLDEIVATRGEGWRLPPLWSASEFGIADEEDAAWVDARIGDQPYGTFTQPLQLAEAVDDTIARAYILTAREGDDGYLSHVARARQQGFAYHELRSAGHEAMVTQPAELAHLLMTVAKRSEGGK